MSRSGVKLTLGFLIAGALALSAQTVIVRPKVTDELLANPGMGIQTFQRFAGQAIYPGKKWSEVGPEAAIADPAERVDFPPSTVAYVRWFWSQLEPKRGEYRWEIIDSALDEARKHAQTVMIRMMPYDQDHPLPEWYRNSGARRANKPEDKDGKIWSPDGDDPLYARTWNELVRRAGERYDGHPFLDSVDISTVGYWGEGWGPYLPELRVQLELVDAYFEAFLRTPKLVNFDELRPLAHAVKRGAGWRLDCWGDMGRPGHANWSHMFDMYPEQLARDPALYDAWRTGPVSLESCGTPLAWADWKFDPKPILEKALEWHASTINIKSTAIPAAWKTQFDEFQKRLGYRFALRRLEHPREARAGAMAPIRMWWENSGVAPVYSEYTLALELRSAGATARIALPIDVRKWLPGDAVFESTVYVPAGLKPGRYRLRVAMLDAASGAPAIRFAMEGRQGDGWYDVSEMDVR